MTLNSGQPLDRAAIDIVFLWCDGNDPDFRIQKNQRLQACRLAAEGENTGSIRYEQYDELKYALRSVAQNAPWIRKIFLVTNRQRPHWLNDHPKVEVVDHRSFIPEALLPVFNSVCIELFLDQIPGLSEHFLYANDDMMLSRPVQPQDFFTEQGHPIVWLEACVELRNRARLLQRLGDRQVSSWTQSVIRAWDLFQRKTSQRIACLKPAHSIDAYTKTLFQRIKCIAPELYAANTQPFRMGHEISRVYFSYEMVHRWGCPLRIQKKIKSLAFLNRWLPVSRVHTVMRSDARRLKRDIDRFCPATICVNNLAEPDAEEVIQFLGQKYPHRSAWEVDRSSCTYE